MVYIGVECVEMLKVLLNYVECIFNILFTHNQVMYDIILSEGTQRANPIRKDGII